VNGAQKDNGPIDARPPDHRAKGLAFPLPKHFTDRFGPTIFVSLIRTVPNDRFTWGGLFPFPSPFNP
jgi:hypothetical protein